MVWTVGEGGKVVPTPIRTGNWIDRNWVVLSGLKPKDQVVVDNLIKIRPGTVVAPKVVPLDTSPLFPATATDDKGGK
jgi:membrane fusion protein (multidrug efflux system)